jgi:hypothetical protein
VKEGAIEALVKCLARIVENVHTLEEYFDTVYPITVSLENLHITRNSLSLPPLSLSLSLFLFFEYLCQFKSLF